MTIEHSKEKYETRIDELERENERLSAKLDYERDRDARMTEMHNKTQRSFELFANVADGQSLHDRIGQLLDCESALKSLRAAYLRKNGCYPLPQSEGYVEMQFADAALKNNS
jgi:hypothetical protein